MSASTIDSTLVQQRIETNPSRLLAPPPLKEPEFYAHGGKLVSLQDLGLWKGHIVASVPPLATPVLRWLGAPLGMEIWCQLAAFFRHANKTWHSEAQARLAYNEATREWKAVVMPQFVGTGMTSNETTWQHREQREAVLARELADGFVFNGTAHSHCNGSAFASGVDSNDEITQTGLHFTLGHVNAERLDVHGRVVFRGICYKIDWRDWFPDWPDELEPSDERFTFVLPSPFNEAGFPQAWLEACHKEEAPKPVYYGRRYEGDYRYGDSQVPPLVDGREYYSTRKWVYANFANRWENYPEWKTRTDAEKRERAREEKRAAKEEKRRLKLERRAARRAAAAGGLPPPSPPVTETPPVNEADPPEDNACLCPAVGTERWQRLADALHRRLDRAYGSPLLSQAVLMRIIEWRKGDPDATLSDLMLQATDAIDRGVTLCNAALDLGEAFALDGRTVAVAVHQMVSADLKPLARKLDLVPGAIDERDAALGAELESMIPPF